MEAMDVWVSIVLKTMEQGCIDGKLRWRHLAKSTVEAAAPRQRR